MSGRMGTRRPPNRTAARRPKNSKRRCRRRCRLQRRENADNLGLIASNLNRRRHCCRRRRRRLCQPMDIENETEMPFADRPGSLN